MRKTEHDSTYYLEKASVSAAILHMAIPMITGMVLDLVYNLVDGFFVGRLDNTAMLAAITLAFPFQIVLMGVAQIFGVGAGTLIPRLLGEKNLADVPKASAVGFYFSLLAGVALTALLLPTLTPLLGLLGASGEALHYTATYVTILLLGSPVVLGTIALAEMIRGEGAATASMIGMVGSIVINILLDPLFIFIFKMNVAGAALATVVANGAAVGYFVWYIRKKSRYQSVALTDFRPNRRLLGDIFKIGSAAFIFAILAVVSATLFNSYALRYGDYVVAAFGVANRLVQIVEFLGAGLFAGIVPLIAYAYASGNRERLNRIISAAVGSFVAVTVALGLLLFLFRRPIFSLFSSDPLVLNAGFAILTAMLVSTLFNGFSSIYSDMFQAFGAGLQANAMALVRGVALIPLIIVANLLLGLTGVVWSLPAAEISASLVGTVLWLASRRRVMSLPLEKRMELVPQEA